MRFLETTIMEAKKDYGDGKFSSEYQPDKEIWTEPVSVRFFSDMVTWLNDAEENIFWEEFIFMIAKPENYHNKATIHKDLPQYLAGKFKPCSDLLEKAKQIQKIKLQKYGVMDKLNASMTKFVLINNHGMVSENSTFDHTTKGEKINIIVEEHGRGTPEN